MSAIAGFFCRDGAPADGSKLQSMTERLRHRGEPSQRPIVRGQIALANLSLDPTTTSVFEFEDRSAAIVGDIRLDNPDALRGTLGIGDPEVGDAELALRVYRQFGPDGLARLEGDFAFAIWDSSHQSLICARDHMGIRPLFYFITPKLFAFATEIKALLALEECPRELNEVRIAHFLAVALDDVEATFYRGILRLPAAHRLIVSARSAGIERYWRFDDTKELRLNTESEYAEGLRSELTRAVRVRLVPGKTGSFMSGGLDSTSISCLAARLLQEQGAERLHTFSAVFPGLPAEDQRRIDERHHAQAAADSGHIQPHFIECDKLNPIEDLDKIVERMDEPFLAANLYIHRAIYREAHSLGLRYLLDGIDGDTTISHGLELLPELFRRGRWIRLVRESRAFSRRSSLMRTRKLVWNVAVAPLLTPGLLAFARKRGWTEDEPFANLDHLNPDFVRRTGLREHLAAIMAETDRKMRGRARQRHLIGFESPLYPLAFEWADKVSAESQIEVRYPFFDRRLMEYCLSLPPELKLRDGWTRWILRRAMGGILPSSVQWRTNKANLSPSFLRQVALRRPEELLPDANIAERLLGYLKLDKLGESLEAIRREPLKGQEAAFRLLTARALGDWLRLQEH